jgi:acetyltransferase-like isoleucine patch superfamily enzyme
MLILKKAIYIFREFYKMFITNINNFVNFLILRAFSVNYEGSLVINGIIFLRNKGTINIEKNVTINSSLISNPTTGDNKTILVVGERAKLHIKKGSGISNSIIHCKEDIEIGENVFIGCGCKIYDHDFHSIYIQDRLLESKGFNNNIRSGRILINDGAFIGANSTVLKGVSIGKNSVIGASSVVTRDIPDNEIWGGNPIRFLKKIE